MKTDKYGVPYITSDELCDELYLNPSLSLENIQVFDPATFNQSIKSLHYQTASLKPYVPLTITVEEFDAENQSQWKMPDEYKTMDIAKWVLDQCETEEELQRVGKELLMFQERGLIDMLRFMKYFVDTLRTKGIVWGVGRGSSTASYVLFLIGVHRINSLYFDLPVEEFLK